jgi:superfamily I DNA/RNA helicase
MTTDVATTRTAPTLPVPRGKQKEVLALDGVGHTVVLGTAGSGKTTMALHRAANLADPMTSYAGKVLLCTFNKTLVAYFRYWQPSVLQGVQFETYHQFAAGYLNHRGKMGPRSICKNARRLACVREALSNLREGADGAASRVLERPAQFFADEFSFIDQFGFDEDGYLATERFGRGARLLREQRPIVLSVYDEYHRVRKEHGFAYDWDDMARAVLDEFEVDHDERFYRHIVIDEGQDFSPAMLRSLAAAVPANGSLTFFGDMAQQIYGRNVSWRQSGLIIPDGPWRFEHNYRNTPEIAALGLAVAAMPYFRDVPDMVAPDKFETSGPPPSVVALQTRRDEINFVIQRARDASRSRTVAILTRRHQDERPFHEAFPDAQRLHSDMGIWDPKARISIGVVHAAKGLEFDQVFLTGLSETAWPEPMAIDADGLEAATASDGQLLYVAVTRARQELVMTHTGTPTSLLPENTGLWLDQTA